MFVQALADAMREQGFSGRQTAALCGVDQRTVSRVLTGTSYPDIATLARLEAGLGVPLWMN
jgi:transcriptional regulator with XRE-family HTH domain